MILPPSSPEFLGPPYQPRTVPDAWAKRYTTHGHHAADDESQRDRATDQRFGSGAILGKTMTAAPTPPPLYGPPGPTGLKRNTKRYQRHDERKVTDVPTAKASPPWRSDSVSLEGFNAITHLRMLPSPAPKRTPATVVPIA
jgi:hypothetical protein